MSACHDPSERQDSYDRGHLERLWHRVHNSVLFTVLLSLASLAWLILRTGSKPSRIAYPCQRAAAGNVGLLFAALPVALGRNIYRPLFRVYTKRIAVAVFLLGVAAYGAYVGTNRIIASGMIAQSWAEYRQAKRTGPVGKRLANGSLATIPAAELLPSPHRVVSVHDSAATSWTGSGNPADYMNQVKIDNMVARGVTELTGEATVPAAWQKLIPYKAGEAVAIKMNFNNVANCDFGADANMNAYAALANAVIQGLKSIGVPSNKIWITDPSRPINDAFRNRISDSNVQYYTKCSSAQIGARPNVFTTDYVAEASPDATLLNPAYGLNDPDRYVRPAQVFADAAHIINIPQLKGHSFLTEVGGITLGIKNHFGSVSFASDADGFDPIHSNPYFYKIITDISANPVFFNKTRLVIGDGLMGNPIINWQEPVLWSTFGNQPPEILFFGADPIAVDSVMFDYIQRECAAIGQPARDDKVDRYAASIGLGVSEHWNNDTQRQYSTIDYHEIDFDKKWQTDSRLRATNSPRVRLSASTLVFSQQIDASSRPETITLTNDGEAALSFSHISISGPFRVVPRCGLTLPSKASCTIDVAFSPKAPGKYTGALKIIDDAPGSPHTISLTGTARTSDTRKDTRRRGGAYRD